MTLLVISEKEHALRQAKIPSNDIGEPLLGKLKPTGFTIFLLPLKIEAFAVPQEIERHKEGYIKTIGPVVPLQKIYL